MGHPDRGALQTHDDERNMTTTELLEEIHPCDAGTLILLLRG